MLLHSGLMIYLKDLLHGFKAGTQLIPKKMTDLIGLYVFVKERTDMIFSLYLEVLERLNNPIMFYIIQFIDI